MVTDLWGLTDIVNSRQNSSKNKLVSEDAVTRVHGSCSLRLWAPIEFQCHTVSYRRIHEMESHLEANHQAQNYLRDVCIVSKTFQSAS